jgi:hypothetical protein
VLPDKNNFELLNILANDQSISLTHFAKNDINYIPQILQDKVSLTDHMSNSSIPTQSLQLNFEYEINKQLSKLRKGNVRKKKNQLMEGAETLILELCADFVNYSEDSM